jgi:flagellar biosynthesis protein FliR
VSVLDSLLARGPASFDMPGFTTWLLVGARVAPSGLLLSLLSRGAVPIWLGLGFALALAAGLSAGLPPAPLVNAPLAWLSALARELCVGLAFASAALVPWLGLSGGVGLSLRSPPELRATFRTLYVLAAAALTLSLGGLRAYVKALSASFALLPLSAPSLRRAALLAETQAIVAQAIEVALALGIPLLMALWLLDLCLALVQRVAHAREKTEAWPLRQALALGLLVLLCAPWATRLPELTRVALGAAHAVLRRLGA